jgi:hypothetical protein
MGSDAENYVKTLQDELAKRNADFAALKGELTGGTVDTTPASVIKSSLIDSVPEYIRNIDALAHASDSESVRLQANKLLIEWAVTDKLITGGDDANEEFRQLLKNLSKEKQQEEK